MNVDHVVQRLREKSATLAEHCPPASAEFREMADTVQATLRELEHTKADLKFVESALPAEFISDGMGGIRDRAASWELWVVDHRRSRKLENEVRAALGIEREAITPAAAVKRLQRQLAELGAKLQRTLAPHQKRTPRERARHFVETHGAANTAAATEELSAEFNTIETIAFEQGLAADRAPGTVAVALGEGLARFGRLESESGRYRLDAEASDLVRTHITNDTRYALTLLLKPKAPARTDCGGGLGPDVCGGCDACLERTYPEGVQP